MTPPRLRLVGGAEPLPPRSRQVLEVRWLRPGRRQDTVVRRFAREADARRLARRLRREGLTPVLYATDAHWHRA